MRCPFYCLACLFLLFTQPMHARIIHVPADSSTIQAAINGCVDGDTALVADGIYTGEGNRDIDFLGKAIVVMSETGPELTIIDCEGTSYDNHRGFYFHNGEDSTSVLQGFTITGGYVYDVGAGIYNEGSDPMIRDCIFNENKAVNYDGFPQGGGMCNEDSDPTIIDCTFEGNYTYGLYVSTGGGMSNSSNSSPILIDCTFTTNHAYSIYGWEGAVGGGVCGGGNLTNCTFTGNTATAGGGGMYNTGNLTTITNCTFSENGSAEGGGMKNFTDSTTITNCSFIGNSAGYGGGMHNDEKSPTITNCTFIGNSADEGGGMYNDEGSPIVANCTFSQNEANGDGGGMYNMWYSSPIVTNCILWGDIGNKEIYNWNSSPIVTYSDIQTGHSGQGNIQADPLFITYHGFDYLLRNGSPCIDAGDPTIEDGRSWPIWYNNGLRSDMGVYGGPGNLGWLR